MVSSIENPRLLQPPWTFTKPDVTEEEYFEIGDEDTQLDLVDGTLYMHSPENSEHNDLRRFLQILLQHYVEETGWGRVFDANFPIRLAPARIFEPDIMCLSHERAADLTHQKMQGPVELVVEVLSPHNRPHDLVTKRPRYREAGVGEVWYIDAKNQQVEVDRKTDRGYEEETVTSGRLACRTVPGFWIEVAWLWERPLPSTLAKTLQILGRV